MTFFVNRMQSLLRLESAGGIFLILAMGLALLVSNSPLSPVYQSFLNIPVEIRIGALDIAKPLLLWINDGLMAVFFLMIGLEVKREMIEGDLRSMDRAILPLVAAIGGMLVPALVYVLLNTASPEFLRGWAIPAATDIAFALGILLLLGSRVPPSLKIFLLAVAIIDDLGAIVIIALFYTADLSLNSLLLAAIGVATLGLLNRAGVKQLAPYLIVGLLIWVCVLKSGVHATLAGVATAMFVPLKGKTESAVSPLHKLEHALQPWTGFFILPLFAFANAGISFALLNADNLLAPVTIGVAAGLFAGKQLGVFGSTYIAIKLGLGRRPEGASWGQLYGLACLTGVGFTMSLFIGTLAFGNSALLDQAKVGVLAGSLASAVLGAVVLSMAGSRRPKVAPEAAASAPQASG